VSLLSEAATSFTLGLATPLSAVCVIPLYPGFLAFLSNQDDDAPPIAVLGVLVALGVSRSWPPSAFCSRRCSRRR
jgi:cytochrome c-type biogenesis protein